MSKRNPDEIEGLPAEDIIKAAELVRTYLYAVDKRILNIRVVSDSEIIVSTGTRHESSGFAGGHGNTFTIRRIRSEWHVVEVARYFDG